MEKFHLPVSAHWLFCFPWNLCCCKEWLSVYSDDVSRFFVRCCLDLGPRLSSCPREQLSSLWTEKNEYVDEFGWCANNLGGDMDLKGFIGQISKCVSHCCGKSWSQIYIRASSSDRWSKYWCLFSWKAETSAIVCAYGSAPNYWKLPCHILVVYLKTVFGQAWVEWKRYQCG